MGEERKKVSVFFHHAAPLILRVDEIEPGTDGIQTARLVAEIPLVAGRNEIDAEHWQVWKKNNRSNPLWKDWIITEEKEKTDGEEDHDDQRAGDGSGTDSAGSEVPKQS